MNLCLAQDSGADAAGERDTKTSFVKSKRRWQRGEMWDRRGCTIHRSPGVTLTEKAVWNNSTMVEHWTALQMSHEKQFKKKNGAPINRLSPGPAEHKFHLFC